MKKIRDTASIPKKKWRYVDPDNGTTLESYYYSVLMRNAKDYRRANNLPIGSQFNEQFEQILCANNPDGCFEFEAPSPLARAVSVTSALGRWAKSGFQVRSSEESQQILEICRGCNFYDGENGVLRVVCKFCKCSKVKVAFRTEHCKLGKW
jgi:hypothetical protein